MSEPKPSETKPKKMVRRNVAVALGIAVIVFAGSLAGLTLVLVNTNQQNGNLQDQLKDYKDIVNLNRSEIVFSDNVSLPSKQTVMITGFIGTGSSYFVANCSALLKVEVDPANPNLEVAVPYQSAPFKLQFNDIKNFTFDSQFQSYKNDGNTLWFPIVTAPYVNMGTDYGYVAVGIYNRSSEATSENVTVTYYS